ncbi:MAG: hypothetical protein QG603_481 [Patescibacteria group bacterium]|nr:hypothetical protein [Patescibacteria group bacterium]MDQ5970704.1 hypothetical protein [Patescibacteria group bacterium]
MLKSIVYILNPLFLLLAWSVFFYREKGLTFWLIFSLLSIILAAILTSGHHFWKHRLQWFNFLIIYVAQFGFLLMLKNSTARYLSAVVLAFLWAFTWWMLKQYFKNYLSPNQLEYLAFKKYWYILNIWFLLSSVYSFTIFLSLHFYYVSLVVVLAILAMTKDLFSKQKSWSWPAWLLLAVFFVQAFILVYFLPVSFYVAGTLLVVWYYYFVTLTLDDKKKAKWPIIVILAVTIFLLLSSLYIIL